MNTNCGQEQDDFDFLKKLERRPCAVDNYVEPKEEKPKLPPLKTPEVTDKDMEELIRSVMEQQAPPPTEKNLQSLATIGRLMEEARLISPSAESDVMESVTKPAGRGRLLQPSKVTVRPVTTPGPRTDPLEDGNADSKSGKPSRKSLKGRPENSSQRAAKQPEQDQPSNKKQSEQDQPPASSSSSRIREGKKPSAATAGNKVRPLTSPAVPQTRGKSRRRVAPEPRTPSPYFSPHAGRRKSLHDALSLGGNSAGAVGSHRLSQAAAGMFEEQKKVDLVALRLEEARTTDLTPKVTAFLKTLLDLDKKERAVKPSAAAEEGAGEAGAGPGFVEEEGVGEPRGEPEREDEQERKVEELKGDRKFDYYATKMALQAASVKKDRLFSLPGTPEEVNLKLVGDQTIKSITMPRLFLHFDEEGEKEKARVEEVYQGSSEVHFDQAPDILTLQSE